MSVYNGERYLAAAVRSVLGQTLRELELIVVDDGSTDDSLHILREIEATDSRLKIISRPNTGIARALNEGLATARGEFVAKMDADDVSLPDRFARQVEFLRQHPDVVVVGGAWDVIDDRDRLLTTLNGPLDDESMQSLALKGHAPITHSCAMMRRSALSQVGEYDVDFKYALDLDLWLRIGEVGMLANLPAPPVVRFRLHPRSISETKRHEQRRLARIACERAWARRGITDVAFDASEPWRPGTDRDSRHEYALKYGWWAWMARQRRTALVYGTRAVLAKPWEPAGYKLLTCAILKPLPSTNS
jgi:glycosyltransferase involved in cell wall biosynthesis